MQAPNFSGPDILGGPDFNLASHKGSFVLVNFSGLMSVESSKVELPHLQTLADQYAVMPSFPTVVFVIVNNRLSLVNNSEVADYAHKQAHLTIPIVDDPTGAILAKYTNAIPNTFVVKPSGDLCEAHLGGLNTTDEFLKLLLDCGAPAPGSAIFDWGGWVIDYTPVVQWPHRQANLCMRDRLLFPNILTPSAIRARHLFRKAVPPVSAL